MIFIHLFLVSNYLDTNRRHPPNLTDNRWHIENNLKPTKRKRGIRLGTSWTRLARSFALHSAGRIVLDYEFYSESSKAMVQIAFSKIIPNTLSN